MIREGRVRLNGQVVRDLGTKADPDQDRLTVDGRPAVARRLRYVAYHKPVGVVSTMSDPQGRRSIGDVIRADRERLFPVGRLDFDSSGLVLLTNDGEVAQRLTHPRFGVPKVYRVKVRGHPSPAVLDRLARGVRLDDGMTRPAGVRIEAELERKTRLILTLHEGRHRQIRRMCEAVGHPVDKLSRVAIGPLRLARLKVGERRELRAREVEALLRSVHLGGSAEPSPRADDRRDLRERSASRSNTTRATSRTPPRRRA